MMGNFFLIIKESKYTVKELPLIVMGDFNQIRMASEHFFIVAYPLPVSGMREIHDCIAECGFDDLENRGVFFSWSNERPEGPILGNLIEFSEMIHGGKDFLMW